MEFIIFFIGAVYLLARISKEKVLDAKYKIDEHASKERFDKWMSEMTNNDFESQMNNYIAQMRNEHRGKLEAEVLPFIEDAVAGKPVEELRSAYSWYGNKPLKEINQYNVYSRENVINIEAHIKDNILRILMAKKGYFTNLDALNISDGGTGLIFYRPIERYIFDKCVKEVSRIRGVNLRLCIMSDYQSGPESSKRWYISF